MISTEDQAMRDMLEQLRQSFRGTVIDELAVAIARARVTIDAGPQYFDGKGVVVHHAMVDSLRAAERAYAEALALLDGMIAVFRAKSNATIHNPTSKDDAP